MKHKVLYKIIYFTRIFQKHSFFILATYYFGSHTAPLGATVSHSLETASLFVNMVIGSFIILVFSLFWLQLVGPGLGIQHKLCQPKFGLETWNVDLIIPSI